MSQYKVIYSFIDQVEGKRYKKGDNFIEGSKTDKKRIKSLCTKENLQGRPLIEEIKKKSNKGE